VALPEDDEGIGNVHSKRNIRKSGGRNPFEPSEGQKGKHGEKEEGKRGEGDAR